MALVIRSLTTQLCRAPNVRLDFKATYFHLKKIGKREIVGYGKNGIELYVDTPAFPMPAIRFKEPDSNINCLRAKEQLAWGKLTMEEKKALYRYSFCQTFSEMKAFTGQWKFVVGFNLWLISLGLWIFVVLHNTMHDPLPVTFDEEHQKAQLKRIILLRNNIVFGLASKWDYENNKWK